MKTEEIKKAADELVDEHFSIRIKNSSKKAGENVKEVVIFYGSNKNDIYHAIITVKKQIEAYDSVYSELGYTSPLSKYNEIIQELESRL